MARGKRKQHRVDDDPPPRRRGAIRRFIMTVVVLLLIVYVTTYFVIRTDGFGAYFAEKLGTYLGMEVSVENVKADLCLDLHLRGVTAGEPKTRGRSGLEIENAAVRWNLLGFFLRDRSPLDALEIDRGHVAFAPTNDGQWAPEVLSELAAWMAQQLGLELGSIAGGRKDGETDVANQEKDAGRAASFDWSKLRLVLKDASMTWWDDQGRRVASVKGVDLFATPLTVPFRTMTHYHLTTGPIRSDYGPSSEGLLLELLKAGDEIFILAFQANRRPTAARESPAPPVERSRVTPADPDQGRDDTQGTEATKRRTRTSGMPSEELPASAEEEFSSFVRETLQDALAE